MIHRDHGRIQRCCFYIDPDLAARARMSGPPFHRCLHADTLVRTLASKGLTMAEIDNAASGMFPICDQHPAA
jgi:hypothetical protein